MPDAADRLETWPLIAAHLGRDVRTAKRYEAERGLPVRRVPGGGKARVYAFRHELDAWLSGGAFAPAADGVGSGAGAAGAPGLATGRGGRRFGIVAAAAVGATVLAAAGAAIWLLRPSAPAPAEQTLVMLAAQQNDTGDAVLDRLVPRLLQIDLTQSPRLQVMGDARLGQALALMEKPRDATLVPVLAREVCIRSNGGVLISPGVTKLGDRYVLTAAATDCVSGRVLSQDSETAATRDDIPKAVDRLAARTRGKLGESRASVSRFSLPLRDARTASFDALRAYSEAMWLSDRGHDAEAVPLFRRAIELDGGFGLAWLGLAQTYYHARQWREDAEAMTRAYALRGSMSEREQLFTAYRFHYVVEKDFVAALASLKPLALLYPHDAQILSSLSFLQMDLGQYDDAVASAEQAVKADVRSSLARTNLMRALIRSGQAKRARTTGDEGARLGLVDSRLNEMRILASHQLGDDATADSLLAATVGTSKERDALLQSASDDYGAGRAYRFKARVARADALGRSQGVRMDWAVVAAAAADTGDLPGARVYLDRVEPDLRSGRYLRAAALADDPARAEAELARDEARWPKDTLRNAEYGPEARAVLALRRGDPQAAVRATGDPDPYEWRTLEFPYIRAQALLAVGDGSAAAAAFRAVLAHPGWSNWPQYDLSHLGLARALRLLRDPEGARREYRAFLDAWRFADADLPQPREARAELAALASAGAGR